MRWLALLSLFSLQASCYKFLAYSPLFATSHMNFMGRITDALIEAGHEVVMLTPVVDSTIKGPGTEKARVISLPQTVRGDYFEEFVNRNLVHKMWTYQSAAEIFDGWDTMILSMVARCNATITYPGLIEQLREEKFDGAFGEAVDTCMPGLFHVLGIDKWAITESLASDGHFLYSHTPTNPAYVPGLMYAEGGEAMSFIQRFKNIFMIQLSIMGRLGFNHLYDDLFQVIDPHFPGITELTPLNSLVFVNTEPLVDFPRPGSARMIDIGGVTVPTAPKSLNQTWSDLFNLRPKNVIISFGSLAKAYLMPTKFKKNLMNTLRKFPNVTFVLKYERPEHRVSAGIDNLVETKWMPQNDMLNDPRLTAFVTHCGQASTTEANYAGVPLVVVPVAFDQMRNAEQMRRLGVGIVLKREDLATENFGKALEEILENSRYKERALKLRDTILDRPFPMKEIFVRNMEFMAKHGPLRQLDHYGRHLNFIQYYMIDIIATVIIAGLATLLLSFFLLRAIFRSLPTIVIKKKLD